MSTVPDPRAYPDRPFIGVSALIAREGALLVVRRAKPPLVWSLPGGLVELGETLEAAARREVFEETGLEIAIERFATTVDVIRHDETGRVARHFVLAVFLGRVTGGRLAAGDDAADVEWVALDRLAERPLTPGTAGLVMRLLGELAGPVRA